MRKSDSSKFKAHSLPRAVIAKRSKPVARVALTGTDCADLIGSMKGRIEIKGDILSTGTR